MRCFGRHASRERDRLENEIAMLKSRNTALEKEIAALRDKQADESAPLLEEQREVANECVQPGPALEKENAALRDKQADESAPLLEEQRDVANECVQPGHLGDSCPQAKKWRYDKTLLYEAWERVPRWLSIRSPSWIQQPLIVYRTPCDSPTDEATDQVILPGRVFSATEERRDGVLCLKLVGEEGWIFCRGACISTMCSACEPPPDGEVPEDIMQLLQRFPVLGHIILSNHVCYWGIVILCPLVFESTLSCEGKVPKLVSIFFGILCWTSALFELTMAGMTLKGRALMRKRKRTALLLCLATLGRLDPYGDATFIAIAWDCHSITWVISLAIFILGVIVCQVIPGFICLGLLIWKNQHPYFAFMYLEMHILQETVEPQGEEVSLAWMKEKFTTTQLQSRQQREERVKEQSLEQIEPRREEEKEEHGEQEEQEKKEKEGKHSKLETLETTKHEDKMEKEQHQQHHQAVSSQNEKGQDKGLALSVLDSKQTEKNIQEEMRQRLNTAIEDLDTRGILKALSECGENNITIEPYIVKHALETLERRIQAKLFASHVKYYVSLVRFAAEDVLQGFCQGYFLYEKWDATSLENRAFTLFSIGCGVLASASGPVLAWCDRASAAAELDDAIQLSISKLNEIDTLEEARAEISALTSLLPDGHPLKSSQKLLQASNELGQKYDDLDEETKTALPDKLLISRVINLLDGIDIPVFEAFVAGLVVWKTKEQTGWNEHVVELAHRAFTLDALLEFYWDLNEVMPHFDGARSTTLDVVRGAIIPLSLRDRPSALSVQMMKGERLLPRVIVNNHWTSLFRDAVAGILADALGEDDYDILAIMLDEDFHAVQTGVKNAGLGNKTYWFDALCLNLHSSICDGSLKTYKGVDTVTNRSLELCKCGTTKYFYTSAPLMDGRRSIRCEANKFGDMVEWISACDRNFAQIVVIDTSFQILTSAWCMMEMMESHYLGMEQMIKVWSFEALLEKKKDLESLEIRNMKAERDEEVERNLDRIPDKDEFNMKMGQVLQKRLFDRAASSQQSKQKRIMKKMRPR